MRLLPSVASADPLRLAQEIDRLRGWPDVHFDMEDGNFTPNITFGQRTLAAVAAYAAPRRLDVHMMAAGPLALLPAVHQAGAASVSAHLEALRFPLLFLNGARSLGMKAGLAVNFSTPVEALSPFVPQMDFLLVMTAEPDAQGETLNPLALAKALKAARTLPLPVYADGGLGEEEILALAEAGAAGCVLGRLVFRGGDPAAALQRLQKRCEEAVG